MKLQKLTIHHIASIEDAEIDFEAKPLSDSEVFLITGKTGAGKSTILDAICLALYDDTPRLNNTKMQGETIDSDKEVKINDPVQLMRRNTAEAYVVLTFLGSNGIHYEARWSVARARQKVTGKIQKQLRQLKSLETDVVLTKKTEIQNEILAATGLDFKQFCRTTMLAQGEFTRFLNSKDDEKAEILEKITGVDIYRKVGQKVFQVKNEKQQSWEEAQRKVEGVHVLTDEERTVKTDEIKAYDKQFQELKKQYDADSKVRQWMKTNEELLANIQKTKEDHDKALAALAHDDFKEKEALVMQWNATLNARMWLSARNDAQRTMEQQQQELTRISDVFKDVLNGQAFEEKRKTDMEAELKEVTAFLEAEKSHEPVYEQAQTIIGHLATMINGVEMIAAEQVKVSQEEKQLEEQLRPDHEKKSKAVKEAEEDIAQLETAIEVKDKAVTAMELGKRRKQKEDAKEMLANIVNAQHLQDALTEAREQRESTRKSLAEREEKIVQKKELLERQQPVIHDAEVKMNTCKELLEKQKDSVDKFSRTLRQKLHVGDVCPVCQQKISQELPHEEELTQLVQGLQQAYDEAEKNYHQLTKQSNRQEAEIHAEEQSLKRDQDAFEKNKSVEDAERKLQAACKICGIEEMDDQTAARLVILKERTMQLLGEVDSVIKEGDILEGSLKELRKTLAVKRKNAEKLKAEAAAKEKEVQECRQRIAITQGQIRTKQEDIDRAKKAVEVAVVGQWPVDWMTQPKDFVALLKSKAAAYHNGCLQRQNLERTCGELENTCLHVKKVVERVCSRMAVWKELTATCCSPVDDLLQRVNDVYTSISNVLSQQEQAKQQIQKHDELLRDFYDSHADVTESLLKTLNGYEQQEISKINEAIAQQKNDELTKKTLEEAAVRLHQEHMEKKPDFNDDETQEVLDARIKELEEQQSDINMKIGAINQELKMDEQNKQSLSVLIADADAKKAVYQKWDRLNQLIGDSTGSKFRKIAQSYVLTSLIHSANAYMKTLTDRYLLHVSPGTFVITVEDAYQGYVSRAASTISGGESFLVSLSLALALSDIGQKLAVDTLFIDEGFGTLSGEPLQNAVNTLRTLHSKSGRHVGIISHVEELQDRIPVQIQVNQNSNKSSSTITIIP